MLKRIGADLFLILLFICLALGFMHYWHQFFGSYQEKINIELTTWHLPLYTFYSMSRGLAAYSFSLFFSLFLGFWAAKDRLAEKLLIPLIDIFQSIPFLGFLPAIVLLFIGIFQHSNVGLELAAILLMFVNQVWNMAFGVYHSIRTVPKEKNECATAYNFSNWEKFKWIELPFSMLSLIWNSIMSMAGAWFYLMVNEAFTLGSRDFRIPGLGSYMSVAVSRGDVPAIISAILAMLCLILFLDQLLWRPLVVWSQKFRIEETGPPLVTKSWFLELIKHSSFFVLFQSLLGLIKQNKKYTLQKPWFPWTVLSRSGIIVLFGLILYAGILVFQLIAGVPLTEWIYLSKMLLITLSRVVLCVGISLCTALPVGLFIGLSEKWSKVLEPILQIGASFPATLLFPVLIYLFKLLGIPLGIGSIFLMLLGTGWYLLFNVIAGAKALPSDLREVATSFRFSRIRRFFSLYIPGVFPYAITGILSASGGAWSASIISEYVTYQSSAWTTPGLGSAISMAAQQNNYSLLAAGICLMLFVVVFINYTVWLRLYHYSEERFALNV